MIWRFASVGTADQTGVVTPIAEGTCLAVGPNWNLTVRSEDPGKLAAAGAASVQFSHASPLDLAISRDENGRITVVEGQPKWWPDKPLACGPPSN